MTRLLICVSNLIKATGKISIEDLIFIIDMLDWKHYRQQKLRQEQELTPLIAQGKAVYENGMYMISQALRIYLKKCARKEK